MAIPHDSSRTGARIIGKASETADGPGPYVMASSTLEGDRVFGTDAKEIGKIKEIMLDVERGRIAYAVMSSGGFLGIGDKLFALPWSALTLDTTNKCFILNVESERIKDAPGFDPDNWPAMADPGWANSVNEFYGTRAHWQDEPIASSGPATTTTQTTPTPTRAEPPDGSLK